MQQTRFADHTVFHIQRAAYFQLSGDTESYTFVEALEFAINTYKNQQTKDQSKKENVL